MPAQLPSRFKERFFFVAMLVLFAASAMIFQNCGAPRATTGDAGSLVNPPLNAGGWAIPIARTHVKVPTVGTRAAFIQAMQSQYLSVSCSSRLNGYEFPYMRTVLPVNFYYSESVSPEQRAQVADLPSQTNGQPVGPNPFTWSRSTYVNSQMVFERHYSSSETTKYLYPYAQVKTTVNMYWSCDRTVNPQEPNGTWGVIESNYGGMAEMPSLWDSYSFVPFNSPDYGALFN